MKIVSSQLLWELLSEELQYSFGTEQKDMDSYWNNRSKIQSICTGKMEIGMFSKTTCKKPDCKVAHKIVN